MDKKSLIIFLFFIAPLFAIGQTKRLDYFINQSLNNNPKFSELHNLILQNRIDGEIIVAEIKLQLTSNGNAYYAPVVNGYGYEMAITNGQQLSALVALNKNIYNK